MQTNLSLLKPISGCQGIWGCGEERDWLQKVTFGGDGYIYSPHWGDNFIGGYISQNVLSNFYQTLNVWNFL